MNTTHDEILTLCHRCEMPVDPGEVSRNVPEWCGCQQLCFHPLCEYCTEQVRQEERDLQAGDE